MLAPCTLLTKLATNRASWLTVPACFKTNLMFQSIGGSLNLNTSCKSQCQIEQSAWTGRKQRRQKTNNSVSHTCWKTDWVYCIFNSVVYFPAPSQTNYRQEEITWMINPRWCWWWSCWSTFSTRISVFFPSVFIVRVFCSTVPGKLLGLVGLF